MGRVKHEQLMEKKPEEGVLLFFRKIPFQKTKIMAPSPITLWQIDGKKVETDFIFLGSKINVDGDDNHEIKRRLLLRRKVMTNLRQHIKKPRHYFANKGLSSQSYGFSSSHAQM